MKMERVIEILKDMQHQVLPHDSAFGEDEIEGAREDFEALTIAIETLENIKSKR